MGKKYGEDFLDGDVLGPPHTPTLIFVRPMFCLFVPAPPWIKVVHQVLRDLLRFPHCPAQEGLVDAIVHERDVLRRGRRSPFLGRGRCSLPRHEEGGKKEGRITTALQIPTHQEGGTRERGEARTECEEGRGERKKVRRQEGKKARRQEGKKVRRQEGKKVRR